MTEPTREFLIDLARPVAGPPPSHTAGPWRVGGRNPFLDEPMEIAIVARLPMRDNDYTVAVAIPCGSGRVDRAPAMTEANARLIASAPDLLAALQLLHDNLAEYIKINNLGDPWHNFDMQQARAALAAATGETK